MYLKSENLKDSFLEQAKAAREGRSLEKKMDSSATLIQAHIRRWLTRKKYVCMILLQFDESIFHTEKDKLCIQPAIKIYHILCRFLSVWNKYRDRERFCRLCQYLISSLESDSPKLSYVGLALNKEYVIRWIPQMNNILWKCCDYLEDLKPEVADDIKVIVLYLHVLVSFTSTTTWAIMKNKNMELLLTGMNQLCSNFLGQLCRKGVYLIFKKLMIKGLGRTKVVFKQVPLSALLTLSIRPLIAASYSDSLLSTFLIHILSIPALIRHLEEISPDSISMLVHHRLFYRTVDHLSNQQSMRIVFNTLEGNYALCLLANLINLVYIERNNITINNSLQMFIAVAGELLEGCQNYVGNKQSNLTHWHPLLGWFSQPMDVALQDAMPQVSMQLYLLWDQHITQLMLGNYLHMFINTLNSNPKNEVTNQTGQNSGNFMRKILDHRYKVSAQKSDISLRSPEVQTIILVCALYQTALNTFPQVRLNILTALCYENDILHELWVLISSLGHKCGLKQFLDNFSMNTTISPEQRMLQLFCDCMTHYITLLDDVEMYEQPKHFLLTDYVSLSEFLNVFIYRSIVNSYFDLKTMKANSFFLSLHTLLLLLYRRDCRRAFTVQGHWLIREIKVSSFMADLEKNRMIPQLLIQNMPHALPHEDRVKLFRRYVINEKTVLGLTESACTSPQSTLITVHRTRIIEDGFRQLALLPSQTMKGVIRVRFINKQGLDEAGIDQDGVFKEFLEESLKRVFDPALNLFTVTSEEKLYPSPTAYLQDDYLQLFEFIGRLLGKAVYEGIVVDAPFAPFFLTQFSGQKAQALYSCIDELPSLDPELYRSLSYIKHYDGDIANLDLTFSVNEERLGKIITQELIPGGKAVRVTNENKINYIHTMAHFRMYVQIKDFAAAFTKGFRSIVNPDWLNLFSTPEMQRLISGDNSPIDLKDLRKHTQYYGGFHDSHKIIGWLWDILEKDFTENERAMFLKFVTSCSKPPLLGFANLEPPFSIRCVEVGDDEDGGDTVGSVFRGFFTIRRKDPQNRLPTSSTCFNLLKLPNYHKKSTLKEKLRYAILSNTGFELS